jgi:hypothetical protein
MNLFYYKDPFPHFAGSMDQDLYDQVNLSWNDIQHNKYSQNAGNRSNILMQDGELYSRISNFIFSSYNTLVNDIALNYPRLLEVQEIPLKTRILYTENQATDYDYKIRGWHLDTGDKFLVGLWYFKHPDEPDNTGGDLMLMNPKTKQTKIFPYGANQLVIFPNIPTAWHAITPRKPCKYPRRYINLILESPEITLHNYKRSGTSVDDEFRGNLVNNFA